MKVLLVLCLSGAAAWAGAQPTPDPGRPTRSQAAALFEQGRSTLEEGPLAQAYLYYCAAPENLEKALACARIDYYRALGEDSRHQRDQAKKTLEEGIGWAQKAVQLAPDSGPAHALLADLYGEKIVLGDLFTGMDFGPKDGEENKKALALAPADPRVLAAQGRRFLMAPDFAGGDPRKALDFFKRSLAADPGSDETWVWLARTQRRLGDGAGARDSLRRALGLNPRNVQAQRETPKGE
ncbi:MAG TPA: tetratricopeptide repeat protein [bacterium]|nr:tetratricopeptide repeat protein [bacterium]